MSRETASGIEGNTSIESLGVYLPERTVTSREVVANCRRRPRIPLERMTGIRSRRVAAETEFSLDLAKRAVSQCLADSRHGPCDIDLIIAANISRQDSALTLRIEPTTASILRSWFGLHRAVAFDLVNACAGVFTAILVVDELIRRGDIKRALVVSGEHITRLTAAAQRELRGIRDPRLACLTVGDAGVSLLLEQGDGLEFMDLYSVPEYADLCLAHWTDAFGPIMLTDSAALARVAMTESANHLFALVQDHRVVDDPDYVIPHQTSSQSILEASRVVDQVFGRAVFRRDSIVDNLLRRGNTATASHWVALNDLIEADALAPGQRVLFGVQASGITIGLAQYRVGEFAARRRDGLVPGFMPPIPPSTTGGSGGLYRSISKGDRVRIRAASTYTCSQNTDADNVKVAARAVERTVGPGKADIIGLLLYCGVYRKDFVAEPALSTLVAQEIGLKGSSLGRGTGPLLAFDVMNGPPGVLNACLIAGRLLLSRDGVAAVAASEYNETQVAGQTLGIASMGSAVLLERSLDATGFRSFFFSSYPQHLERYSSYAEGGPHGPRLRVKSDSRLHEAYVDALARSVRCMLHRERLTSEDFQVFFAPALKPELMARLAAALEVNSSRLVTSGHVDLFTSGPAASWEASRDTDFPRGSLAMFLTVGPGIEVGCATYQF